jgi:hypothetical protein
MNIAKYGRERGITRPWPQPPEDKVHIHNGWAYHSDNLTDLEYEIIRAIEVFELNQRNYAEEFEAISAAIERERAERARRRRARIWAAVIIAVAWVACFGIGLITPGIGRLLF